MVVYQEGYYCNNCKKIVRAKIHWSKNENDTIASCTICGEIIQKVIHVPYSPAALKTFDEDIKNGS